jgi:MtaA/CmuA family methyltransferase
MDMTDSPFPRAHREPQLMANLAETGHTVLGFDSIMPVFSIIQESVALGMTVDWMEKDNWATCRGILATRPEDIKFPKDWLKKETAMCVTDAIRELRRRQPDAFIIGKTMGPWTMGYHWFGTENSLLMSYDDPDAIKKSLDIMKETTLEFGWAQIEAGADALTIPDHATGDLVNAEYYHEFLFDLHSEMSTQFSVPVILHICGRTVDRMEDIGKTGFAAFHFDSKNLPEESIETIGTKCQLVGNINNPTALYTGTPDAAYAEAVRAMNAGVRCIGPECAVPLRSPLDNLKAIGRAVRDYPKMSEADRLSWAARANTYDMLGNATAHN